MKSCIKTGRLTASSTSKVVLADHVLQLMVLLLGSRTEAEGFSTAEFATLLRCQKPQRCGNFDCCPVGFWFRRVAQDENGTLAIQISRHYHTILEVISSWRDLIKKLMGKLGRTFPIPEKGTQQNVTALFPSMCFLLFWFQAIQKELLATFNAEAERTWVVLDASTVFAYVWHCFCLCDILWYGFCTVFVVVAFFRLSWFHWTRTCVVER